MRRFVIVAATVASAIATVAAQPTPFRRVDTGLKLPAGFAWNTVAAVVPDSQDHLWIMQRGNPPILEFDKNGNLLKSLGEGRFALPHGLAFDREGHIWAVDSGPFSERGRVEGKGFQVFKMDQNGNVLLTLGKPNVAQTGTDTFLGPTGVAIAENGDVFISDGHTPRPGQQDGDRVVKFSKDGKFLQAWGRRGNGPGEFNGPHGILIDRRGRVLVADRDNHRVQLFDQAGNYLGHWMHYARPSGIWIDDNDVLYVSHNADTDKTLVGWQFGIRFGSAKDGTLTGFIPDLENEVVGGDHHGAIYSGGQKDLIKFVRDTAK